MSVPSTLAPCGQRGSSGPLWGTKKGPLVLKNVLLGIEVSRAYSQCGTMIEVWRVFRSDILTPRKLNLN